LTFFIIVDEGKAFLQDLGRRFDQHLCSLVAAVSVLTQLLGLRLLQQRHRW
jgi:hypothetical protein